MAVNLFDISHILTFILIFSRTAGAITLMPAIGDNTVPARVKIIFSLLLSLILFPIITNNMTKSINITEANSTYFFLMLQEIFIGIFIGMISKFFVSALHIAGTIISMQSGLSSAAVFNMNQNSQTSVEGNLFLNLFLALFFIHNLHHLFILGFIETYDIFPFTQKIEIADSADFVSQMINKVMNIAFKISSPFLIINTSIFIAAGVLARLMPTIQIFYLMTPVQMLVSFFVMLNIIAPIISWYTEAFSDILNNFRI